MNKRFVAIVLAVALFFGDTAYLNADILPSEDGIIETVVEDGTSVEDVSFDDSFFDSEISDEEASTDLTVEEDLVAIDASDVSENVMNVENEHLALCGVKPLNHTIMLDDINSVGLGHANQFEGISLPAKYVPDYDTIPNLRDQNPYGSCWAHASIAQAEFSMMSQGFVDKNVDYSEMALAYFTYNTVVDPLGGTDGDINSIGPDYPFEDGNFLDIGGNMMFVGPIFSAWKGATSESLVPYTNFDKALTKGIPDEYAYNDVAHLRNYYVLDIENNPETVKNLIKEYGAVGISYYHDFYSFDYDYNSYYIDYDDPGINHAVTVVGWDDNFPKENFHTTAPGDGAWLIRNSWTTNIEESENGYFWLSYYDNSIANDAYCFLFENSDNYDNNYQYDGCMDSWSYGGFGKATAANVFTVKAGEYGETLEAVGFETMSTNVDYEISIYVNPDSENPESGTKLTQCTTKGSTTYQGYYTVELNEAVSLNPDTTFSVVVSIEKEGEDAYLVRELENTQFTDNWFYTVAAYDRNQSYYFDGAEWLDIADMELEENYAEMGNFRIKAFTSNNDSQGAVYPEIIEINNVPESKSIELERTKTFKATYSVFPGNATNNKVLWTSSDETVATVDANGVVTARHSGTAVITAKSRICDTCDTFTVNVYSTAESLSFTCDETIYYLSSTQLISMFDDTGEDISTVCEYTSSNCNVIYISQDGKAYGVGVGTSTVTAECEGLSARLTITVLPRIAEYRLDVSDNSVVNISWNPCEEVDYYVVERKGENTKTFDQIDVSGQEKIKFSDYDNEDIDINKSYVYTIYSYGDADYYSSVSFNVAVGPFYTITYVLTNCESNPESPRNYRPGQDPFALPEPVYDDYCYEFEGWYLDENFNNRIEGINPDELSGNITVYSHVVGRSFYLEYGEPFLQNRKFYGWSSSSDYSETFTYGEPVGELRGPMPQGFVNSPVGGKFLGWTLDEECDYSAEARENNPDYLLTEDTVFEHAGARLIYAVYEINGIGIEPNNGITYCYKISLFNNERYGYNLPSDEYRYNCTFDGWYTDPFTGIEITEDTIYKDVPTDTIYAHWIVNDGYKVTFDFQGGACNVDSVMVPKETTIGIMPVPHKAMYDFAGWYYNDEPVTRDMYLYEDAEFVAHWEPKNFVVDNPFTNVSSGSEVEKGTKVSLYTSSEGALIYYTTSPEIGYYVNPDNGTLYEDSIVINSDTDIWAIAVKENYQNSEVGYFSYTVKPDTDWGELLIEDISANGFLTVEDIPKGLWVTGIENYEYCGKAITQPDLHVYNYKLLLSSKDYSVKYSNNTKAGTATVTVTGKGNYSGMIVKSFEISPLDISGAFAKPITLKYNKKVQKGTTSVTYELSGKTVTLKAGTDYEYKYTDTLTGAYKESGEYVVLVVGKGNYCGETSFAETITNATLMSKVSVGSISNQKYTGSKIEPKPIVKSGKTTLEEGKDYELSYEDNIEIGTALITITAIGDDYVGEKTVTFKITGTSMSKVSIKEFKSSIPYSDGDEIVQPGTMYLYDKSAKYTLIEDTDYTVSYTDNVDIGKATVIFTGKGKYSGTIKKNFNITGKDIQKCKVSSIPNYRFNAEYFKPDFSVTDQNGKILVGVESDSLTTQYRNVDYVYNYSNNYNKGTAKINIVGVNNYSGKLTKKFKITVRPLYTDENDFINFEFENNFYWEFTYVKGGVRPEPIVTLGDILLVKDVDYTITYQDNKKVGMGVVWIYGKGNFKGQSGAQFTILESSLDNVTMTVGDVIYKEKPNICKPSVTLYDSDGTKLSAGKDYKNIKYSYVEDTLINQYKDSKKKSTVNVIRLAGESVTSKDIIPVGTYLKATAQGKGNYPDSSISGTFKYVVNDISKATIKVNPQTFTGKPVEPMKKDISVKFGKTEMSKTDYEIVGYSNNNSTGTGKITLRGVGNYGGEKTVSFKISAKSFMYNITFDKNGDNVKGTMKVQSLCEGKSLTTNAYKRTGYVFDGWNTNPDGTGISYGNKEKFRIKDDSLLVGENVTLYAQWKVKE